MLAPSPARSRPIQIQKVPGPGEGQDLQENKRQRMLLFKRLESGRHNRAIRSWNGSPKKPDQHRDIRVPMDQVPHRLVKLNPEVPVVIAEINIYESG